MPRAPPGGPPGAPPSRARPELPRAPPSSLREAADAAPFKAPSAGGPRAPSAAAKARQAYGKADVMPAKPKQSSMAPEISATFENPSRPERIAPWKKSKEALKPPPVHENDMDYEEAEDVNEAQEVPEEESIVVPTRPASKYGGPGMPTTAKQPQRVVAPHSKQAATPVAKLRAKPLLQQEAEESWGAEDGWEGDSGWAEDDSVQHSDGVENGEAAGNSNGDEEPWLQPMPKHHSSAVPDAIAPAVPKGSWSSSSGAMTAPLRLRRPDELAAERSAKLADDSGTLEPPAKRPKTGAAAAVPESLRVAPPQPKTATAKSLPQASAGKTLQLVTNPNASAAVQAYLRNPAVSGLPGPKASQGAPAPSRTTRAPSRGALPPGDWEEEAQSGESPWAENGEDEYWPEDSGTHDYAAVVETSAPSKTPPPTKLQWPGTRTQSSQPPQPRPPDVMQQRMKAGSPAGGPPRRR